MSGDNVVLARNVEGAPVSPLHAQTAAFSHYNNLSAQLPLDPETGELVLGDIVISVDKVMEQAEKYGHSRTREYAFLIAHSMLHLFGYDHMVPEEARVMEAKQAAILESLNILR